MSDGRTSQPWHEPVMLREVIAHLIVAPAGRYVDATVGGGGHAEAVLEAAPQSELLGIDRDGDAMKAATARLSRFGDRVRLVRGSFSGLGALVRDCGWEEVDGILMDIGVSSHQLNTPKRGFSHRADGPLDMRMDDRVPTTAASLLNRLGEDELARVFREYGEEPNSRRIARAVVQRRSARPWARTGEFAELLEKMAGGRAKRHGPPPAARCFQALRIAVNDELGELEKALGASVPLLRDSGRIVVISFHSLEDRIVKRFLRAQAAACVCPAWFPECRCDKQQTVKILTRKPLRPGTDEVDTNSRAAPARLRAAEKL